MDHEAVLPDRVREPGSVLVIRLPIQNEVRSLQNYRRYVLESIAQGILVLGKDVTYCVEQLGWIPPVVLGEEPPVPEEPEPSSPQCTGRNAAEKRRIFERLQLFRGANGLGCLRRISDKCTFGITDDLLREEGIGKQAFAELLAALLTPGTMLAAYNAQFDLLFLYAFLQKYGDARLLQDKQKLDLLTVYRDRRAYPHRLCNAIEQYDLQDRVTNSHRAIDDVRATVEVLRAMGTERDDLERYVDLFGYSSKYGISGPRISSVRYLPQGYEPKAAPLYAGL